MSRPRAKPGVRPCSGPNPSPLLDPIDAKWSAPPKQTQSRDDADGATATERGPVCLSRSSERAPLSRRFAGRRTRGWAATAPGMIGRRKWRAGWDADMDRCPPDPGTEGRLVVGQRQVWAPDGSACRTLPERRYTRHAGRCAGERWEANAATRQRAERTLREAGYVARREWARERGPDRRCGVHTVPSWRYLEGPATGLEAVDPWRAAWALRGCARAWAIHLLRHPTDGRIETMPAPHLCSRRHWCPSCAPRFSSRLAWALRTIIPADHLADGLVSLATTTHRDHPRETLAQSIARWHRAWQLVTRGRAAKAAPIQGLYYGLEATRGAQGKRGAAGQWWHVHAHVIIWAEPGIDPAELREWWAVRWAAATAQAAEEAGIPGYGWQRSSGEQLEHSFRPSLLEGHRAECRRCRRDDSTSEVCSPWWQPVTSPGELYQAAKYPTPIADLSARHLAEFLAAAHGRRWHQGSGLLRSVVKWAEELAPEDPLEPLRLTDARPGRAPMLRDVAPELGIRDRSSRRLEDAPVVWRLAEGIEPAHLASLRAAGLEILHAEHLEVRSSREKIAPRVREDERKRIAERAARAKKGPTNA